jgi:von Willebrand factor A domain-containing protein 8
MEDGEMALSDGRTLSVTATAVSTANGNNTSSSSNSSTDSSGDSSVLPIHPDFRLWTLVNRPGYPFHGNDFFR